MVKAKKQKHIWQKAKQTLFAFFCLLMAGASLFFIHTIYYRKNAHIYGINYAIMLALIVYYTITKISIKDNTHKLFSLAIFCYFLFFSFMMIMRSIGMSTFAQSATWLKKVVLDSGVWGIVIFIAIQAAQVVFSIIPGLAATIVGAQIFGPLLGSVYSTIGNIIGSILAFVLGRLFGKRFVEWYVGKEAATKYRKKLNKKGKYILPVAFLMPFFPDDILCWIAGITTMTYKFFIITILITRPITVLVTSYLSGSNFLPFKGYYLFAWAAIFLVIIIVMVVLYIKQEKIEQWLEKKFKKTKQKV